MTVDYAEWQLSTASYMRGVLRLWAENGFNDASVIEVLLPPCSDCDEDHRDLMLEVLNDMHSKLSATMTREYATVSSGACVDNDPSGGQQLGRDLVFAHSPYSHITFRLRLPEDTTEWLMCGNNGVRLKESINQIMSSANLRTFYPTN